MLSITVTIHGTRGRIHAFNPLAPQYLSWLRVKAGGRSWRERPPRSSTYLHQLEAFCDAALDGSPFPTTPWDAVANMSVIDSVYRGRGPRPSPGNG